MSNAEELVRLDELLIAGDRELVPIGPEIAGYVVLEAALRVRDVGGGVAGATELAIDLAGNVVLVAPPRRADEARAAASLRKLLGALLQVATSSTPALRACAKRKDSPSGLLGLARELEGALIPLNRSASRRGVARIAREALELLESGELDLDADDESEEAEAPEEPSPSPPPVVRTVAKKSDARAKASIEEAPELEVPSLPPAIAGAKPRELTPPPSTALATDTSSTRPTLVEDATPQTAPAEFVSKGTTPTPFAELAAALEAAPVADDEPFEVVSHLPPPVVEATSVDDEAARALDASLYASHAAEMPATMRGAELEAGDRTDVEGAPVAPAPERQTRPDRVKALAEAFQVSRTNDDPGLARELKKMVGVETGKPPEVVADIDAPLRVTMRPKRRAAAPSVIIENEPAADEAELPNVDVEAPARPARRVLRSASSLAVVALAAAAAFFGVRGALANRQPTASPPETVTTQSTVGATSMPTATGQLPATCEATLVLEGVTDGSEVARKLGTAPLATTLPVRVPFDVVALAEGRAPQRAHLDASAAWKGDATGPQLDVTIALDGKSDAKWPARVAGTTALRNEAGTRGLVHVRTNPDGASVWLVVDPHAIAVPCGSSVDLLVVTPNGASKPLHLEWSAFSGFPAKAVARLN